MRVWELSGLEATRMWCCDHQWIVVEEVRRRPPVSAVLQLHLLQHHFLS